MNKKSVVKIAILFIIVGIFGIWYILSSRNKIQITDKPIGTFIHGNMPNYEYIVINRDNQYMQYNYDQIILEGNVTFLDEIVYIENENETISAIYLNYKLYVFDKEQNRIRIFEKMSDVPTYINLQYLK